jgi:hypothetical protein
LTSRGDSVFPEQKASIKNSDAGFGFSSGPALLFSELPVSDAAMLCRRGVVFRFSNYSFLTPRKMDPELRIQLSEF